MRLPNFKNKFIYNIYILGNPSTQIESSNLSWTLYNFVERKYHEGEILGKWINNIKQICFLNSIMALYFDKPSETNQ